MSVQSWQARTQDLITLTTHASGGYTDVPRDAARQPTLHATFHAMRASALLGGSLTPAHATATAQWISALEAAGRFRDDQRSQDTIGEIYYGISTLYDLKAPLPDTEALAQTVHKLQYASGPYAMSEKLMSSSDAPLAVKQVLLSTYEALHVLQMLRKTPKYQETLRIWLETSWDRLAQDNRNGEGDPSSLSRLIVSLHIIDPNNPRLQTAWAAIHASLLSSFNGNHSGEQLRLIYMATAVEAAQILGISSETWRTDAVLSDLVTKQNFDGGYNTVLDGGSDVLGTFLAASVFQYFHQPVPDQQRMAQLINLHANAAGGYFTFSERPPRLDATWGVVHAAPYVGKAIDRTQLAAYLETMLTQSTKPKDLYLTLSTAKLAGFTMTLSTETLLQLQHAVVANKIDDAESLFYATAVFSMTSKPLPAAISNDVIARLDQQRKSNGSYGHDERSALRATALAMNTFYQLGYTPPNSQQTIDWIRQHQHGGFAEAGSSPTIDLTYVTVTTLNYFNSKPASVDALTTWIGACFAPEGGVAASGLLHLNCREWATNNAH